MDGKICHLTSVHPIDDVRIFFKECISLKAYGFDVTLITCGDKELEYTDNGIRIISICIPVKNRLKRILLRPRALYRRALQVDAEIYHFHDPELLPIGLRLKERGKKVIYDAHEDLPRQILIKSWIPAFLRKPVSIVIENVENYYVRRLDAVVTVTNHIAKRFFKISPKVVICANYASLTEFDQVPEWGNPRNHLCYIGSISEIRGIVEIVEAVKKAKVVLQLAGDFSSKILENKIINREWVNYLGHLNRKEVRSVLSRCFAGIVTFLPAENHTNSCPNKLFEYMASGIPIIASNFEDWKRLIEDNNAGICVDPTNIDIISRAIYYLKENPKIAQQMGENGRKAFEGKYNWQIMEKRLKSLYDELLIC